MSGTLVAATVVVAILGICAVLCVVMGPSGFVAFLIAHVVEILGSVQILGVGITGIMKWYRTCAALMVSSALTLCWGL